MNNLKGKVSDIYKSSVWVLKLLIHFSPGLFFAVFVTQIITAAVPFIRSKIFSQLLDSLTGQADSEWITPFISFMVVGALHIIILFFARPTQ